MGLFGERYIFSFLCELKPHSSMDFNFPSNCKHNSQKNVGLVRSAYLFHMIFTKQQLNEGCLKSNFKVKQTFCEVLIFLCTNPVSFLLLCITEATSTHRSMLLMKSYLLYHLFPHSFQTSTGWAHNSTL